MCGLLCLLPVAAAGQTLASLSDLRLKLARPWDPSIAVPRKEGVEWNKALWQGGMMRPHTGDFYIITPNGIGDIIDYNYIDGFSFGPHAVFGWMLHDRSRLELEGSLRVTSAESRRLGMWRGAVRWFSPVEKGVMVELRGSRHSEDFNHHGLVSSNMAMLASSIFSWKGLKLLDRTEVGIRANFPLREEMDFKGNLSWERREKIGPEQYEVFREDPERNIPRVRIPGAVRGMELFDTPVDGKMLMINAQVDYQRDRQILLYDDMTAVSSSPSPKYSLCYDAGFGTWNYLSLGAQVRQYIDVDFGRSNFEYMAGLGTIVNFGDSLGLADWHHFNAMRFWLQGKHDITLFRGLDNYELSTDKRWLEAHAEFITDWDIYELEQIGRHFTQIHLLKVPDQRFYWEWHTGLEHEMGRLSIGASMNGGKIHDVYLTLSLSTGNAHDVHNIMNRATLLEDGEYGTPVSTGTSAPLFDKETVDFEDESVMSKVRHGVSSFFAPF